ncbi:MAG TPA: Sir2 family NAD+-dependent deacetylase [Homoserinimonas sp.]|nr:Sir2 family NAD+-dependent deacetylase [Homoserinimonas sp.]
MSAPIVILTGAGVSAESGIRTFRAADGLWEEHRIEDVATPEGFAAAPALVHRFYNERRRHLVGGTVHPNPAHVALARLEAEWPGEVLLVTQNIDDLHERAGSQNIIHMHGELLRMRCEACEVVHAVMSDISVESLCPGCAASGTLRPHVVWFGEMPLELDRIFAALGECQLFAAIGTSGNVYPAAGFVEEVRAVGARTVEINLERSVVATSFDEVRLGPASEQVPLWVDGLLTGR